ncbi:hypothetical protein [Colwellia psychrerythraea]|uniref:Uncharacterized protein n=1 Tax=Colwellia psychrerythraea TaxID=28229 RepID=A0A099KFI2_COLPS|nr:hypothetical protein [Colwellia psychrerythraea]KGJ88388.1 hypothetical protein ND2E_4224 [Colwellia psychrerythraea]
MANLSMVDKRLLEDLFGMGGDDALGFSERNLLQEWLSHHA